jgi:hypothetical protein
LRRRNDAARALDDPIDVTMTDAIEAPDTVVERSGRP